jgi:hypothetical protein
MKSSEPVPNGGVSFCYCHLSFINRNSRDECSAHLKIYQSLFWHWLGRNGVCYRFSNRKWNLMAHCCRSILVTPFLPLLVFLLSMGGQYLNFEKCTDEYILYRGRRRQLDQKDYLGIRKDKNNRSRQKDDINRSRKWDNKQTWSVDERPAVLQFSSWQGDSAHSSHWK